VPASSSGVLMLLGLVKNEKKGLRAIGCGTEKLKLRAFLSRSIANTPAVLLVYGAATSISAQVVFLMRKVKCEGIGIIKISKHRRFKTSRSSRTQLEHE
jgi:uncharacterized membrane protein